MNRPDVSVIIAAYNNEETLSRAVESALAQEGVALEVVIVDDASADGTWALIGALTDPRVRSFRMAQNGGPSAARNSAIEEAAGEWIAILDGDDAFAPDRLARLLARARVEKADIIVDNLEVHCEAGGAVFPMFSSEQLAAMPRLTLARFIEGNQCFLGGGEALGYLKPLFNAEFLKAHALRYDPDVRIGEDYRLMADALACGAVCVVEPSAGYLYTARAGSISHRLSLEEVDRIAAGDKRFLARHGTAMTQEARRAQAKRTARLAEARAFTVLVVAIKSRNLVSVLQAWLAAPLAPRHLWRAVWVRAQSLLKKLKRLSVRGVLRKFIDYIRNVMFACLMKKKSISGNIPNLDGFFPLIENSGCLSFGQDVYFRSFRLRTCLTVLKGARLEVGAHTFINDGVNICASEEIVIGRHTKIGDMVYIYDTNFHEVSPMAGVSRKPVVIGNNVWICANCMVLAGSTIGDHSVIAAGSIVSGTIPPRCLAAGVPAKVIKTFEVPDDWVRG